MLETLKSNLRGNNSHHYQLQILCSWIEKYRLLNNYSVDGLVDLYEIISRITSNDIEHNVTIPNILVGYINSLITEISSRLTSFTTDELIRLTGIFSTSPLLNPQRFEELIQDSILEHYEHYNSEHYLVIFRSIE